MPHKKFATILLLAVSLLTLATDNLSLGTPGPADCIVDRTGYALGYIEAHEQPAWVIYRMTRDEAVTKAAKRSNKFKPDPAISTGSASPSDYTKSGFDRGHLAPAADMAFSVQTMEDSFYMSNMSPQRPGFNRGVWKDLEAQVRAFAVAEGDIYVVTGPIFSGATMTIGANNVTVPQYYYKVVYDTTPPEKMIGFILPNEGSDRSLSSFAVTVDAVENATGLDFFSALPKEKQEQLESTITIDAWNWIPRQASYRSGSTGTRTQPQKSESGRFWVSSSSKIVHNSTCKYYRKSKGYATDSPGEGTHNCKQCGGAQ